MKHNVIHLALVTVSFCQFIKRQDYVMIPNCKSNLY